MPTRPVPLKELAVAVESAVEQVLAKHGAVSIDHLWVGFVAPLEVATEENARKIAERLGKEADVKVQPSVGQLGVARGGQQGAGKTEGLTRPGHIIGLVYAPPRLKD